MRPFSRNLPERSVLSLFQTSLLLDHWSEKRESFQEVLNSSWADQAVWGSLVSKPLALAYSIGLPSRRWYSSRTTLTDPIFELDNDTQPPLRLQITEWCCPLTRANATVDCCVFTLTKDSSRPDFHRDSIACLPRRRCPLCVSTATKLGIPFVGTTMVIDGFDQNAIGPKGVGTGYGEINGVNNYEDKSLIN